MQHGIGKKGKKRFHKPETHLTTSKKNHVTISEEIKIYINTALCRDTTLSSLANYVKK